MLTHTQFQPRDFCYLLYFKGRFCQKATPREQVFGSTRTVPFVFYE
ncbi:MAG: hypothetical protein UX65_C0002G0007 [Parcubacteria group bacterium GW2011_GWB1_46_8]|nr:MAG: hypothetical protein UX65_C0002G0007 [Parcubacteria group bacterium GW2011_GWB1_46_8]